MENVTFTKQGTLYVATFTTNDNAAFHAIREGKGRVIVSQSSVNDGNYRVVDNYMDGKVLDFELTAAVFPKYWEISSESPVISAVYTEGE